MAKILIVDDDPFVCGAIARLLRLDHEVVAVTNQETARSAASSQAFDIALVDLHLHGGPDGLLLREELEAAHPNLAVILITGGAYNGEDQKLRGIPVLEKPFTSKSLSDAMASLKPSPR